MKYVIAAVPYSDNLGDAVIADNLEDIIYRNNSSAEVELCDISYRDKVESFKSKEKTMYLFSKLPQIVRQCAVFTFFSIKYLLLGRKYYDLKLKNCDLLFIGGGQLLCDVDLNFPLKLYFLIRHAERLSIPTKFVAVGVASKWNWLSKRLAKRILLSPVVKSLSARDELSKENIKTYFDIDTVTILPDPALLSCFVSKYQNNDIAETESRVVGVGIVDVDGLNYSSDLVNNIDANSMDNIHMLVSKAIDYGYCVSLFTNGATEDEHYLHSVVIPTLQKKNVKFSVIPRVHSSVELVQWIKSFDMVIAYRLHAMIIASSFNIPYYGVSWDNKVRSFFKAQNNENNVYDNLFALNKNLIFEGVQKVNNNSEDLNSLEIRYRKYLFNKIAPSSP